MKDKILVADDMMMDREVLTELLDEEFEVTAVEDGEAAVKALEAEPDGFACVLLDIMMPKLDGFGVLRYMREKGCRTPVIALTSLTDSEGHIRCYEAGVSELLEKPYDRKILLYKVRRMIGMKGAGQVPAAKPAAGGAGMDVATYKMLLRAFGHDFSTTLANLKKAIAEDDNAGLHAASHAFSGIEANLKTLLDS